jgi:hypothetical protein
VLRDDPPVAGLHGEHVELPDEPGPGVQPPAGVGDQPEDVGGVQVLVGEGAARQELDRDALAGPVVHHGRPDAGGRGGHAVAVLGVAVDLQQLRARARDAHDHNPRRRDDLEVAVGEAAGQVGHGPRVLRRDGDGVEERGDRGVRSGGGGSGGATPAG